MRRVAVLLVVAAAHPAAADLRVALDNDVFTDLDPPIDDAGFTHDFDVRAWRPYRGYLVGGALLDRWVTSRVSADRIDLVQLAATGERTWLVAPVRLTAGARVGPVVTGNLGGRWTQNAWHTISKTGPTLDEGLQHHYVHGLEVGVFAGGRLRAEVGDVVGAYANVDAQGAAGTGVSWIDAAAGVQASVRAGRVLFGAHVELAGARYAVADDALALPGGYGTGWQHAWRAGGSIAWRRVELAYEYRANEGNSGEPIGVVAVTVKQAGTTF